MRNSFCWIRMCSSSSIRLWGILFVGSACVQVSDYEVFFLLDPHMFKSQTMRYSFFCIRMYSSLRLWGIIFVGFECVQVLDYGVFFFCIRMYSSLRLWGILFVGSACVQVSDYEVFFLLDLHVFKSQTMRYSFCWIRICLLCRSSIPESCRKVKAKNVKLKILKGQNK